MSTITLLCLLSAAPTPYQDLFRLPIPEQLPPHPRVFCTPADLDRVQADLKRGDAYTITTVRNLVDAADAVLEQPLPGARRLSGSDFNVAERLAIGYAVTGQEKYGRRCVAWLANLAEGYQKLQTTRSKGRVSDSTLGEGPIAVRAANAYDLVAGAPFLTAEQRRTIEQDLLYTMAWECGHLDNHRNSSNWRTWGICIVASCGFAIGDRKLMEEAVNGVWDPEHNCYLYGVIQTLTHSVFSDGIHWERSLGYTYYTASALMYALEAAKNSGVDLWQAKLPGILGPFVGGAGHEEYGPAGDRSPKPLLDAPFYLAFPNGDEARINDSGTSHLAYHPIYELAWREYHDPKYAWLIHQQRAAHVSSLAGWSIWRAEGQPTAEPTPDGRTGGGVKMVTAAKERVALVQDVTIRAAEPASVTAWVKAVSLNGGKGHLRANIGEQAVFTNAINVAGDWQQVQATIPPRPQSQPGDAARVRLHVFLDSGAGEVIWDDVSVTQGDGPNLVLNPALDVSPTDGRGTSFWELIHSQPNVPTGHYDLSQDATIGLTGQHRNGCTLFPIGGYAVLRADPHDLDAPAALVTYGPYGSGHDHPDRLHLSLYGLNDVLGRDAGSWGYDNPMHLTWANQTIAHNTLTVDETAQEPQGKSKSIWAGEQADQRVFGVLRAWSSAPEIKLLRVTCETAYPGVLMDRTIVVRDGYVLDLFRATSKDEHTYDLAFHGLGEVSGPVGLKSIATLGTDALGYRHLTRLRRGSAPALLTAEFKGDQTLRLLQAGTPGEIILALDPRHREQTSAVIRRAQGRQAAWATVYEPVRGQAKVQSVELAGDRVTVNLGAGQEVLTVPAAVDSALTFTGADGRTTTVEAAAGR